MQPSHHVVFAKIAEIEAEMRRIGMWQDQPIAHGQLDVKAAFGADKISFDQWLQFVFVPRVNEIVAVGGQFPSTSQVAAQAHREWDNRDNVDVLLKLLRDFDGIFG